MLTIVAHHQVGNHVVVGMGSKIRVYRWYKRTLEMCGFLDTRIHAVALRSIKDTYVSAGGGGRGARVAATA